jgi:hypothetical protein
MNQSDPPERTPLREMITEAIRYWEPRRLVYNAVLAAIVCGYFVAHLPDSRAALGMDGLLTLFLLAVLANGCYCAAYFVDLFAQYSAFRPQWLRWRSGLFVVGVVFAAILTRFFALGFFAAQAGQPVSQ